MTFFLVMEVFKKHVTFKQGKKNTSRNATTAELLNNISMNSKLTSPSFSDYIIHQRARTQFISGP